MAFEVVAEEDGRVVVWTVVEGIEKEAEIDEVVLPLWCEDSLEVAEEGEKRT